MKVAIKKSVTLQKYNNEIVACVDFSLISFKMFRQRQTINKKVEWL